MLKSEGILSFLKKTLLMREKSYPLDIFSHNIPKQAIFLLFKTQPDDGTAWFFFLLFLALCCLESLNPSSLLQVHNRKPLGASFRSLVPPWTPHAGRSSFPRSLNKADSHPAQQSKCLLSNMAVSPLHATEDPDAGSTELDICTFEINIKHEVIPSIVCSFFFSLGLIYCFLGMYTCWFYH